MRRTALVGGLIVALTIAATPSVARPASGHTRTATWLLNHLVVGPTNHAGYDRSKFKLWDSAGNGCDVRDRVLIRDAVTVHVGPGCYLTGKWKSPYDAVVTSNPTDEQVDHVVPLADAWGAGAWKWNAATREAYANDLGTRYDLLAVSAHSNESKSDRDPSAYLPPRKSFDCRYMTDYVAVMWRWRLHISASLKSFLQRKFLGCPALTAHEPPRPTITDAASASPSPTPTATQPASPTPTPTSSTNPGCTRTSSGSCAAAGEFCPKADEGQYGYDAQGRRLYCGSDGHWHYA